MPAFLKSNVSNNIIREPSNSGFLPFHQRSNSENGANYVSYSPYALRRKEIGRPFSPPMSKDVKQSELNPSRSFSPYRQQYEQSITRHDYSSNSCATTTNGQGKQDTVTTITRPFSPYRTQDASNLDNNSRSYSPYRSSRYDERDSNNEGDRWQSVTRSLSPFARDYSPWRRENVDPPGVIQPPPLVKCDNSGRYSPFLQQRFAQSAQPATALHTHSQVQDIYGSPMISRKR